MARNSGFTTLVTMAVATTFGLLFWVLDSWFEFVFFHDNLSFLLLEGPESFMESLALKVPVHSLFVRCSFLAAVLVGGGLTAAFLHGKAKSEAAMRAGEARYRNIFESARDAIILYSHDTGKILDVNRFACDLYGYSREEMLTMTPGQLSIDPAKTFIAAGERANWTPKQYHRKKSAEIFPTEISVSTTDWNGRNICTVVIRDISDRIEAEKEKKRLAAELHRAQKMEALGTLAGGVAHDLNNILLALVGYPDLLLMDLPEDSPLRTPILTIQKSGKRAADIVQDLLTLARRGVTITQVVNLNTVVSDYLDSLEFSRLKASHPHITFEIRLEPSLGNILGSPIHLTKTIMNLTANAVEAIVGSGKISISTDNTSVGEPLVGYENVGRGEYVRFRIVDTGMGISEEDLPRVFEPFYTRKVMGRSGTGLGMAVVWGTVKDHNGYIDLQSVERQGTRCDLYFPVTRENRAVRQAEAVIDAYRGSERILVVDDVKEQREIIHHMLTRLGYRVTTVENGEAAVEYLKTSPADLLILDMIMDPGMDGLATYRLVKKLNAGQKAIICSGFSETDRVRETLRLGAGAYLKKPYIMQELGEAVRRELDRAGA